MSVCAIITGRGGSSYACKNTMPIAGRPCVTWVAQAVLQSQLVTGPVFIDTDSSGIAAAAQLAGPVVHLPRPPQLALPSTQHAEVIRGSVDLLINSMRIDCDIVVVLLANSPMITWEWIDRTAAALMDDPHATGACTAWRAADDHPLRCMGLGPDGYAQPYLEGARSTNRQEYPPAYFYDAGPWVCRVEHALSCDGPPPWPWLGPRPRLVHREWVTGRDIHGPLDAAVSAWWLTHYAMHDRPEGV